MKQPPIAPLWAGRSLALLGILVVALSLRSAVAAISPIVEQISVDIPISSVGLGLLGMLPPILFAASGIIAPMLARRIGIEFTLVAAIVIMTLGHLARGLSDTFVALLISSALALLGMGLGNVLLPPVVKRYFPDRIGMVTSGYLMVMSFSTALPALFAAPIADSAGWRVALAMWAAVSVFALVPWIVLYRRHRRVTVAAALEESPEIRTAPPARVAQLWRSPLALAIVLAFTISSVHVYVAFAWLPGILMDTAGLDAVSAGGMLAMYAITGLPCALVAPVLLARLPNPGWSIYLGVVSFAVGLGGLLLAPATLTWLWVALAGCGTVMFPISLVLLGQRTRGPEGAIALSGFMQLVGYTIAAFGPLVVGILHDATGGWTSTLVLLLVVALTGIFAGIVISKPGYVEDQLVRR